MTEYNGVYGDYEWEIVRRTLKVFSRQRRIGLLKVFENVNAINSEQAQWSIGLAANAPNPTDSSDRRLTQYPMRGT